MEFLPDQEAMTQWLLHYGSFSLFILLALGVFALPVPDETLMVLSGILMKNGELPVHSTLAAAFLGSMFGITLSYLFGRIAGSKVLHKYGSRFGLTEEKLNHVHAWFEKYGKWTLTFGYFVPGVRHLTGFAAGSSELEYPKFALFAYFGATIWASFFLSLGYFLGDYLYKMVEIGERIGDFSSSGIIIMVIALFFLYRWYKSKAQT